MKLVLIILGVLTLLEGTLWLSWGWRDNRGISRFLAVLVPLCNVLLFIMAPAAWSFGLLVLSGYRLINYMRVIKHRTQIDYLYHSSRRTSLWLIGLQTLILLAAWYTDYQNISTLHLWLAVTVFQAAVALIVLLSLLRSLRTTRPPVLEHSYADRDLPTLSVCIPARNETVDLEECLKSLTISTYPKLEILVLDDCSQNKRTPEIIRDFAHDGVRFISGEVPPEHWLAKNYAYQQLTEEASGDILLFCGVDARFEPDSLKVIVETLLNKDKHMLSVLPKNVAPIWNNVEGLLVQPSRYAWELALPRRLFDRPPVLSTCWAITRQALEEVGGFEAVRRSSQPERYLAWQTAIHHDGYTFQASSPTLGVTNFKRFDEQQATAIRTRYPQLHRRPELIALVSLIELVTLVLPFTMLLASLLTGYWSVALTYAAICLVLTVFYVLSVRLTYRKFLFRSLWLLPFAALYDIGLLNYSMWQYEFNEVLWKGRNVCIPVMRVITKLPALPR